MQRLTLLILIVSVILSGCASQSPKIRYAPSPVVAPTEAAESAWNDFLQVHPKSTIKWDPQTGHAREVLYFHTTKYEGAPTERARQFIAEHSALLGIPKSLESIRHVKTTPIHSEKGTGIDYVRFEQWIAGSRVEGTEIVVHTTTSGSVFGIHSRYYTNVMASVQPDISSQEAISISRRELGTDPADVLPDEAKIAFLPSANGLKLTWKVLADEWVFHVDAENGNVVSAFPAILNQSTGSGNAFIQNSCTGSLATVSLENLDGSGFLRSTFHDVVGAQGLRVSNPTLTFPFMTSQEKRLSQVGIYFHLEQARQFFTRIGFTPLFLPATAIANHGKSCNAAFLVARNAWRFGLSSNGNCGNSGHDGDIVVHEYTHKVVDESAFLSTTLDTTRAIHEGVADYFAASFFADPCIAETLSGSCGSCLRRANNQKVFPRDIAPGDKPHATGKILSGALFDLRSEVNPEFANRVALGALSGISSSATFADYARAAIFSAAALVDQADNFVATLVLSAAATEVPKAFCNRGITIPDELGGCQIVELEWFERQDFGGQRHTRRLFPVDHGRCMKLNHNDKMSSLRFHAVRGWKLQIFDDGDCDTNDDWGEIVFPAAATGVQVVSLTRIGSRGPSLASPLGTYQVFIQSRLAGKVSAIKTIQFGQ